MSVLRRVVTACCVEPALAGSEDREELAEDFLHLTGGCLSEGGTLLVDYDAAHPVQDDFDLFTQAGIELDPMRVQYVIDGLRAHADEIGVKLEKAKKQKQKQKEQKQNQAASTGAVPKTKTAEAAGAAAEAVGPTGVALESLISQVKDLLPDLGGGFVEACLEYFDFDPEKVINAIFEDNLPPHLATMSRTKDREAKQAVVEAPKKKEKEKKAEEAGGSSAVLEQKRRYNVFDGDAYDINERNDIDRSKIWKGKHSLVAKGSKNANALLDDKAEIKAMKKKFEGLDIVSDEVIVAPADSGASMAGIYDPDYDDEYDDTYDDNAMGEAEPDAKDEMTERRPFVLPRALGGGHVTYVKEKPEAAEEENEEAEQREKERRRKEFVRNPAEVREERERKWQERQNKSKGGRPPPNRDVVGRAKGQGQDKQVLINRARKNANKGKQHRAGADRKAARNTMA